MTVLLAACGGGSSSGGPTNPADPSGAYYGSGQFADAAGNDTLMLVESNNTYWIFYTPPTNTSAVIFVDKGTAATVTSQTFGGGSDTDYAMLYDDPTNNNAILPSAATAGAVTTGLTASMDYTYHAQIDGSTLTSSNAIFSTLVPLYISGSAGTGSLATVAGSYTGNFSSTLNTSTLQSSGCFFATAFTVGSNGAINGTLDDCSGANLSSQSTVSGTLTPRTDIKAFDVTLTFTADSPDGNPLDGATSITYTGIAYFLASNSTLYIAGLTSDGQNSVAFAGSP
jgi:hypothetical protein